MIVGKRAFFFDDFELVFSLLSPLTWSHHFSSISSSTRTSRTSSSARRRPSTSPRTSSTAPAHAPTPSAPGEAPTQLGEAFCSVKKRPRKRPLYVFCSTTHLFAPGEPEKNPDSSFFPYRSHHGSLKMSPFCIERSYPASAVRPAPGPSGAPRASPHARGLPEAAPVLFPVLVRVSSGLLDGLRLVRGAQCGAGCPKELLR